MSCTLQHEDSETEGELAPEVPLDDDADKAEFKKAGLEQERWKAKTAEVRFGWKEGRHSPVP